MAELLRAFVEAVIAREFERQMPRARIHELRWTEGGGLIVTWSEL